MRHIEDSLGTVASDFDDIGPIKPENVACVVVAVLDEAIAPDEIDVKKPCWPAEHAGGPRCLSRWSDRLR